jgi:hypothetical protein
MLLNMLDFAMHMPIRRAFFAIAPNWQFPNGEYNPIGKLNVFYIRR